MFHEDLFLINKNGDDEMILCVPSGKTTTCGSATGYKYWSSVTLSDGVIAMTIGARPNEVGYGLQFILPDGQKIVTGEFRDTVEMFPIFLPKGTIIQPKGGGQNDRVFAVCYHGSFVKVDSDAYFQN